MSTQLKRRISVLLGATVVALGACELAARAVFPAPPNPVRQPQIKYKYDREIRYLPLPNQHGWIDDGFVNTNAEGFRGPEPVTPKPAGRFRIVAIGDSVTFGFGVNDGDTFCAQLEALLRHRGADVDVVNLAVPGYDTRQEVTLLKRNVERLQPDLVLVGFYSNDVPDSLDDKGGTTVAAGHDEPNRVLQMNPVPTSWWNIQMRKSRAVYAVGRALNRLNKKGEWGMSRFTMELDMLEGRDTSDLDAAWRKVAAQFSILRDIAEESKFSVGVVVLPPREQVVGQYAHSHYQSRVETLVAPLGFFVIDPLPALTASPVRKDELYIAYDRNHPSKAGHSVIAQAIAVDLDRHDRAGIHDRFAAVRGGE